MFLARIIGNQRFPLFHFCVTRLLPLNPLSFLFIIPNFALAGNPRSTARNHATTTAANGTAAAQPSWRWTSRWRAAPRRRTLQSSSTLMTMRRKARRKPSSRPRRLSLTRPATSPVSALRTRTTAKCRGRSFQEMSGWWWALWLKREEVRHNVCRCINVNVK